MKGNKNKFTFGLSYHLNIPFSKKLSYKMKIEL